MKDLPRLCLDNSFLWFFAIIKPSLAERQSIKIDIQGWLGSTEDAEAKAVLGYGGEIKRRGVVRF
jgi:hypothetical protein